MRHLNIILTLAAKDGRVFLADRRAAFLCFAVPVLLASVFGIVFDSAAGKAGGAPTLPMLVVIESDGPFTRRCVDELLAGGRVDAEVVTRAEAEDRVADLRPGVAVVFPVEFEQLAAWTPGSPSVRPCVRVLHSPLSAATAPWAEGIVSEAVGRRLAQEKLSPWIGDDTMSLPRFVETESVGSAHTGFNSYTHSFSGMTLQYLLFWGMESGLLLLRERQRGLWSRLRAAPVPLGAVLLGKALSTTVVALLMVLATFGFGAVVFGVSVAGSWVGFALLAVAASVLSASIGLLVAAVGGTEARARGISILVILAVSLLGGLWLPAFALPGWARDIASVFPTTWAMRGLDGVTWQGRSLMDTLPAVAVVTGFAAVFLAAAIACLLTTEARRGRGRT